MTENCVVENVAYLPKEWPNQSHFERVQVIFVGEQVIKQKNHMQAVLIKRKPFEAFRGPKSTTQMEENI